jgi:hypothetical protein
MITATGDGTGINIHEVSEFGTGNEISLTGNFFRNTQGFDQGFDVADPLFTGDKRFFVGILRRFEHCFDQYL